MILVAAYAHQQGVSLVEACTKSGAAPPKKYEKTTKYIKKNCEAPLKFYDFPADTGAPRRLEFRP